METAFILIGLSFLYMAKAAYGNRDENYMDHQIESYQSKSEKEKNVKRGTGYILIGTFFILTGITLALKK